MAGAVTRWSLILKFFWRKELYQNNPHHYNSQGNKNLRKRKDRNIMALRMWENSTGQGNARPGFIFTIMTYNVLAQEALREHPYLYRYHDQKALDWNVRWNNIFKEIKVFHPDILCLQEVQESHVKDYFEQLKCLGYRGIYKKRTGVKVDGCAVYYKINNIHLTEYTEIEYYQPNISVLNRDNVGLVVKFAPKLHPTRKFIVATTHLLYNPRRDDVRMAQTQLLLAEIDRIWFKHGKRKSYVPIIITGDFNTYPDSDLYRFLINGEISYNKLSPGLLSNKSNVPILITSTLGISDSCKHIDILEKKMSNATVKDSEYIPAVVDSDSNSKEKELSDNIKLRKKLSHDFAFKSVYNHGSPEDVEATTYHQSKWVTVDYIFYSTKKDEHRTEDKLKFLSRYRLPTSEELSGAKIPNRTLGSDHLSLLAKFKLEF